MKPRRPKMMQWVPLTGHLKKDAISCQIPLPDVIIHDERRPIIINLLNITTLIPASVPIRYVQVHESYRCGPYFKCDHTLSVTYGYGLLSDPILR